MGCSQKNVKASQHLLKTKAEFWDAIHFVPPLKAEDSTQPLKENPTLKPGLRSEPHGSNVGPPSGTVRVYSDEIQEFFRSLFEFGEDEEKYGQYLKCHPLDDIVWIGDCYPSPTSVSTLKALNATEGWYFGTLIVLSLIHI